MGRTPALRPRDAGSLVIVDDQGRVPRLLMGRRAPGHAFMAGKYVFPGGRVERADLELAAEFTLPDAAASRLLGRTSQAFHGRHAVAVALAAIRETFEEVGTMIGVRAAAFQARATAWRDFAEEGVRPGPEFLVPFARAITPPRHVRRYDTRFFVVPGTAVASALPFDKRPSDEFDHVAWIGLDDIDGLELAPITHRIIADLAERLCEGSWQDAGRAMPFYRERHGRPLRDLV